MVFTCAVTRLLASHVAARNSRVRGGIIPIIFSLGGITPSGLRKEAVRGRLLLMSREICIKLGDGQSVDNANVRPSPTVISRPVFFELRIPIVSRLWYFNASLFSCCSSNSVPVW